MKQKNARIIKPEKQTRICYTYQHMARFASGLNRLPDAAAVRKQKAKAAPLNVVEMVF